MMKPLKGGVAFVILFLGLRGAGPAFRPGLQMSMEEMEKKIKEAAAASAKARRELGQKFLPRPENLGTGWLLPWEVPQASRKVASEDEYWKSQAGNFDKDDKAWLAAVSSAFLELSPPDLEKFLNFWFTAAKEGLTPAEIPEGYTAEQFALGTMILLLRWQSSPSLAGRMEMIASYLGDMQAVMAKIAEARFGAAGRADSNAVPTNGDKVLRELVLKPVKGRTNESLKQEIFAWAAAVKDMTGLVYAQCDDWPALQSGDEKAAAKARFRQVVVTLTLLDRNRMGEMIGDLTPEAAASLQRKLNDRLSSFRDFGYDILMKKRAAELDEQIDGERNPDRQQKLRQERARLPELLTRVEKEMPKVDFEVYTRGFGDNCYVINMKGDFKLPELVWPATNLQACLRNGNAVVWLGLGGNFAPEKLKKELDLFLSEMDVRTAFFR